MAALRLLSSLHLPSSTSTSYSHKTALPKAVLQAPMPKIGRTGEVDDRRSSLGKLLIQKIEDGVKPVPVNGQEQPASLKMIISKLRAVADAAADRAEMHDIIGEQRADWNKLLLNSINSITLAAATMAGLSVIGVESSPAFKVSATILFTAATGLLLVVNKIQPSQLAEEQRNATRLFRQLHSEIEAIIGGGASLTADDVDEAMERVLALDRAYPLPLLPGMLEKFPAKVEPTVWWPASTNGGKKNTGARSNGWNGELEKEMKKVSQVLKKRDVAEYVRLSELVLKVNKGLAFAGPFLTGLAAISSMFIDSNGGGVMVAMAAGAMATVVNTLEHGGQVGMVFEMYRNCGGLYRLLEERIERSLNKEAEMREDGELFELKMALQLGRSVSELRNISDHTEFAGKLF